MTCVSDNVPVFETIIIDVAVFLLFFDVVMVDGAIISIYSYISILFIGYKHTSYVLYTGGGGDMTTPANHVRNQRRNQNARQAMMISGLSTIYRNQTTTHAIQTHQQTEPRIFLLDITLEDMNERMYSKIHAIIEKGRIRGREGTETFFVYKKKEHVIMSEDNIYEIRESQHIKTPLLVERIPVDGAVTLVEICISVPSSSSSSSFATTTSVVVPLLVDESHYKLVTTSTEFTGTHISPTHIVDRYTKINVKLHPKSMNSFVFIMNDDETEVLDFYFTTENGIIENSKDKITTTCKEDIISFIDHFKLCS